ncbi:MAG TPA: acyltransferase [Burkholderiaceae bacterium]|jgi:peptidoglycan/LPS O-acetylase OafA/YrhL
MNNKNQAGRFIALDAVRGIAALVVVFNHYVQTIPEGTRQLLAYPGGWLNPGAWATPWPWLRFTPFRLLVDGHAAVIVFFLLSGFVLALQVKQDSQPLFVPFLIKRVCRIFLPFAFAIALSWWIFSSFPLGTNISTSQWFKEHATLMSNASLIDHLLMNGRDMRLNPVMWSLIHEMRMAIFLPLMFVALRRIDQRIFIAVALLISIVATFGMTDANSDVRWQATAHFFWLFAIGSSLAFHRTSISTLFRNAGNFSMVIMWALALGLLMTPFDRTWSDFLMGAGAILLIVLSLQEGKVSTALSTPIPVWLGRISYSLYLIHLPILVFILSTTNIPMLAIFVLTLLCSELTYRVIEAPAHKIGIVITERLYKARLVENR